MKGYRSTWAARSKSNGADLNNSEPLDPPDRIPMAWTSRPNQYNRTKSELLIIRSTLELRPPLTGYPAAAPPPSMAGDRWSWAIQPHGAPILSWLEVIRRTGYDEHTGMHLTANGRLVGAGRGDGRIRCSSRSSVSNCGRPQWPVSPNPAMNS